MLTRKELEVLQLCAEGLSNNEIAKKLIISEHTVKTHLEHIFIKMKVSNRTCAAIKGIRLGIIK